MAHHNRSRAFRTTYDKETLNSCALVARSFRPTSQTLIFSDLTILPPGRDSIPALQRLADVLSVSPHLALHVRTLNLVQPGLYKPCLWMQSDILPAILSVFTNLESLHIRIYNWDSLHLNCEQAIYALIARSSLSSIEFDGARLKTDAILVSLLRSLPASLESVSFSDVFADHRPYGDDLENASPELNELRLASLHLDSYAPTLFHWAIGVVDPECLRHLHTTVEEDTMDVVQQLLDSAVHVETYHLSFRDKMRGLRTLEISVTLDWEEIQEVGGQGQHNPLNDAMRTLDTAPQNVEHLVLNLNIWNPSELSYFMRSMSRLGEDRPALRDVVVRIRSRYSDYSALQRGIRYLEAVFHRLNERGMLTVIAVHPQDDK
ncbi:hypothetical protein B0H14DRAFT_2810298 [Mycena olivaceomarginata]|nr:hypothetical protein B0H14DRAFT_2810298 [Mycena olivaceomarginata]